MIQLFVECDGDVPYAFQHDAVSGVRVHRGARHFQILEGPESAVMLGVAVLAHDAAYMARTTITARNIPDWHCKTVGPDALPACVAARLAAFADATTGDVAPDARQAIGFLNGLVEAQHMPAITSGRRLMSKVGGQSGKRAWMAV